MSVVRALVGALMAKPVTLVYLVLRGLPQKAPWNLALLSVDFFFHSVSSAAVWDPTKLVGGERTLRDASRRDIAHIHKKSVSFRSDEMSHSFCGTR